MTRNGSSAGKRKMQGIALSVKMSTVRHLSSLCLSLNAVFFSYSVVAVSKKSGGKVGEFQNQKRIAALHMQNTMICK